MLIIATPPGVERGKAKRGLKKPQFQGLRGHEKYCVKDQCSEKVI